PFADVAHHLHVGERWRSNANAVRRRAAVADGVVAVGALGGLDAAHCLAGWNDGSPTDTQKMGDQRFDIVHREFLYRWRSQGVICFVAAVRHAVEALTDDAKALSHLLHAYQRTVVAVAVGSYSNIEIELVISRIRLSFSEVPVVSAGS